MSDNCCGYICLKCPVVITTDPPYAGSLLTGQIAFDATTGFYYYQHLGQNLVLNPSYGAGLTYNLNTQSVSVSIVAGGGLTFNGAGALLVDCAQLVANCGFVTQPQLTATIALLQAEIAAVEAQISALPPPLNLTAGTGISISGTYPNLVVATTSSPPPVTTNVLSLIGANLTSTVNGVASTVSLADLVAALTPLLITTTTANTLFSIVDCPAYTQLTQRCTVVEGPPI